MQHNFNNCGRGMATKNEIRGRMLINPNFNYENESASVLDSFFFLREPGNEKFHCNKNDHFCYRDGHQELKSSELAISP